MKIGIVFDDPASGRTFKLYKTLSGAQGACWRSVGNHPDKKVALKTEFGEWAVEGVGGYVVEVEGVEFDELFPPVGSGAAEKSGQVETRRTSQKYAGFPGCQLAKTYKPGMKFDRLLAEPKMDGYRLCAMVSGGEVRFCTRTGLDEPYTANLEHVGQQLLKMGFRNCLVDGEVVARGDFGSTAIVRHVAPDAEVKRQLREDLLFHIFDWVDLSNITLAKFGRKEKEVFEWTQVKRREFLEKAMKGCAEPNLRLTPQFIISSEPEILDLTDEMMEMGFEGLMLKDPLALYSFDRSVAWLKVKPFESIDLKITEFVEGGGKHRGRLGAIVGHREGVGAVSVGTGFDDAEREDIWARQHELMGTWMEAKVQKGSNARHPVFLRFRPDRQ